MQGAIAKRIDELVEYGWEPITTTETTASLAGRLGDWLGTRATFLLAVVWWSVANVLHGFATGWRSLAFYRTLLGIGEAGNFPTAGKVVAEWFPPEERTLATGIFNLGAGLGAMLAPPLVTVLLLTWSWRAAFVVTGALGRANATTKSL